MNLQNLAHCVIFTDEDKSGRVYDDSGSAESDPLEDIGQRAPS